MELIDNILLKGELVGINEQELYLVSELEAAVKEVNMFYSYIGTQLTYYANSKIADDGGNISDNVCSLLVVGERNNGESEIIAAITNKERPRCIITFCNQEQIVLKFEDLGITYSEIMFHVTNNLKDLIVCN